MKEEGMNEAMQENMQEERMQEERMQEDINAVIALLDGYTRAGDSRIKVNVVEGQGETQGEVISRKYHHGRCDVGSPWATGTVGNFEDGGC